MKSFCGRNKTYWLCLEGRSQYLNTKSAYKNETLAVLLEITSPLLFTLASLKPLAMLPCPTQAHRAFQYLSMLDSFPVLSQWKQNQIWFLANVWVLSYTLLVKKPRWGSVKKWLFLNSSVKCLVRWDWRQLEMVFFIGVFVLFIALHYTYSILIAVYRIYSILIAI